MKKLTISIVASFAISVALAGNVTPPAVVTNAGTYSIEIAASNAPSVWTAVRPYIVADPKLLSALQAGATIGPSTIIPRTNGTIRIVGQLIPAK